MSVANTKALLANAVQEAGEGHGAVEQAREYAGAAIEKAVSAGRLAAAALDDSNHDLAAQALTRFVEAESHARAMIEQIDRYGEAIAAAQEACQTYIGLA